MKKHLFFALFGVVMLLGVSACKDKTPKHQVTVNFKAVYAGQPLKIYERYDYDDMTINFYRFNTFISDLTLDGEKTAELAEIDYLDFTPQTLTDSNALVITRTYEVEEGSYAALNIGLGVKPELNAKRPSDFELGHPLTNELEYWSGWQSYIFTKIEGEADGDGDGQSDIFMIYHCGSDAAYRTAIVNKDIAITGPTTLDVEIDIAKIFKTDDRWLDIREPSNRLTSNLATDTRVAEILMESFTHAVSIK